MDDVPKAKTVYAELAAGLSPGQAVFLSLQVDTTATDPFTGGGFRIELERSEQRVPARGLNGTALFFQLLMLNEIEVMLAQQNRVIASRPTPPEQVALY